MANNNANARARNWCAIIYPDSAPKDWKQYLNNFNIKWACSPLHDKDIDDDSEKTTKKAHWHIVLCYSGNKSFEQVRTDLAELKCAIPQICRDVRCSVRYFIHKDSPHKYQYNEDDIECYGGFDIGDFFNMSKSEIRLYRKEMADYIEEHDIIELMDFDSYCRKHKAETWYRVLSENSTIYFDRLIKSNRHRPRHYVEDANGNMVEFDSDGVIKE